MAEPDPVPPPIEVEEVHWASLLKAANKLLAEGGGMNMLTQELAIVEIIKFKTADALGVVIDPDRLLNVLDTFVAERLKGVTKFVSNGDLIILAGSLLQLHHANNAAIKATLAGFVMVATAHPRDAEANVRAATSMRAATLAARMHRPSQSLPPGAVDGTDGPTSSQLSYETAQPESDSHRVIFHGVSQHSLEVRRQYPKMRIIKKGSAKIIDTSVVNGAIGVIFRVAESIKTLLSVPKPVRGVTIWINQLVAKFQDLEGESRPPLAHATELSNSLGLLTYLATLRESNPQEQLIKVHYKILFRIGELSLYVNKDFARANDLSFVRKLSHRISVAQQVPEVFTSVMEEGWVLGTVALPSNDMLIAASPSAGL